MKKYANDLIAPTDRHTDGQVDTNLTREKMWILFFHLPVFASLLFIGLEYYLCQCMYVYGCRHVCVCVDVLLCVLYMVCVFEFMHVYLLL